MTNRQTTPRFTSYDLFDPTSTYSLLRPGDPQQTLHQFFHALAARQLREQARSRLGKNAADTRTEFARGLAVAGLVLRADAPETALPLTVEAGIYPQHRGPTRLLVSTTLRDPSVRLPAGLACRALLLTADVVEMLCGAEALASSETVQAALQRLFVGEPGRDPLETAGVLSAVPELNGWVGEDGECLFDPFELPAHARYVSGLPPRTVVVIVVEPAGGEQEP